MPRFTNVRKYFLTIFYKMRQSSLSLVKWAIVWDLIWIEQHMKYKKVTKTRLEKKWTAKNNDFWILYFVFCFPVNDIFSLISLSPVVFHTCLFSSIFCFYLARKVVLKYSPCFKMLSSFLLTFSSTFHFFASKLLFRLDLMNNQICKNV